MPTIIYHLYRVKFIKPAQIDLFGETNTPADIFWKALSEKPSKEMRRSNVWHIGNIEPFDDETGCFAVGRTTKTTNEKYNDNTGDFIEEVDDKSPYTYVIYDKSIGLIGIAQKSKVAKDVKAIASKIRQLFERARVVLESNVEVRVDHIPDPDDFLVKIRNAYSIKKFKASFTGPNPIDADELFQKPLSVYCQKINGQNGSVEVHGTSLNEQTVEAVAKATAATGNTASARIQPRRGKRTIPIYLKGDAVQVAFDQEEDKRLAVAEMREKYFEVRDQ